MANDPKAAKQKADPHRELRNAQDLHEGSAHRPEDFDAMNPARQTDPEAGAVKPPKRSDAATSAPRRRDNE